MSEAPPAPAPAGKSLLRFAPIVIVVAGLAAAYALGVHRYLSLDGLVRMRGEAQGFIASNLVAALAVYVIAYAVLAALSIPGAAFMTIAGGFLFGVWLGGVAAWAGALLGAIAIFLAARTAFAGLLRERVRGFVSRLEAGFRENAFNYLLTLRLIPAFPFWVVNLAPAFLDVRVRDYIAATAIGMFPGALVYAAIGASAALAIERGEEPSLSIFAEPQFVIAIFGLAALSVLPLAYRAIRGRKSK
jgi:uncharacterized membrane protein YdjX (TVP38/TMEM64 family)